MVNNRTGTATAARADGIRPHEFSASEAVVEAVAEAEGVSPSAVDPPLYEVIDPDALDDLFAARSARTDRTSGRVVFPYRGYEIAVTGNGDVELSERFHGE